MKTAISLPDSVFEEAEKFAHKIHKSRSQLYMVAIKEYLSRHETDNITEAMNGVCDQLSENDILFTTTVSKKILSRESW